MPILYPLGILESDFWEYWKCAQLFGHWAHWSQMAGHIQNVLSMCPLGISGSHNRVYLKCTQHLITGHIGVTCWLWSQCFHHVPSGYLGPCPQCEYILNVPSHLTPMYPVAKQLGTFSIFTKIWLQYAQWVKYGHIFNRPNARIKVRPYRNM